MRFMRPFTARVINRITRRVACWLPGFAILCHRGRKSGRTHCTPINVFRRGNHYLFALTYGSDVDWVKNVFAAGGAEICTRGRNVRLVEPELIVDPTLSLLPRPVALLLRRVDRVTEIVRMRAA